MGAGAPHVLQSQEGGATWWLAESGVQARGGRSRRQRWAAVRLGRAQGSIVRAGKKGNPSLGRD